MPRSRESALTALARRLARPYELLRGVSLEQLITGALLAMGGAVAGQARRRQLYEELLRTMLAAGLVLTEHCRVRGGGLACAGELACWSRKVAVRAAEIFLVTELFRRYDTDNHP